MNSKPTLSIVLPSHNNGREAVRTIERIYQLFPLETEVIVVVDGSTDHSIELLSEACREKPSVRVLLHSTCIGKGTTVKDGILSAQGKYIAFLDADRAVDPLYLSKAIAWMEEDDSLDGVVGWRKIYHTHLSRKISHAIFHAMTSALFRMPFHDTQTPMKVFRRDAAQHLFRSLKTARYAFDVELLLSAINHGLTVREIPVTEKETGSSINALSLLQTMAELLRLYQGYIHNALKRTWKRGAKKRRLDPLCLRHLILWPGSIVALAAARLFLFATGTAERTPRHRVQALALNAGA